MITSIEIENLRGIAHGKLDGLTGLTVLIGKNGSGKSSVLDAIWILTSKQPGKALDMSANRHSGISDSKKWFLFKGDSSEKMKISGCMEVNGSVLKRVIDFEYDLRYGFVVGTLSDNDVYQFGFAPGEGRVIQGNPISETKMVGRFSGLGQPIIHDLFSSMTISGREDEAISIIRNILPAIENVKILTEGGTPYLFVSYKKHSVPIAITGEGVYALAQLGLELALQPGGVVLIEEPEIHLHPAAIRQTAKVIWGAVRRGVQVILTTHSIEFIDGLLEFANGEEELAKLSVFRTLLDDGQLKVSRISGENVEFARNQIGDDLR
ncbi:ATP/GTP-binding protein [Armatimonas sp.]|uniref:AAA family ATPase n=1 Tax=Armatimonas sp. TaxID=1872638 RepID=UPI00374D1FC7